MSCTSIDRIGNLNVVTDNVTEVLRSRINVGTNANINPSPAPVQVNLAGAGALNEIPGLVVGASTFDLPAGNYEAAVQLNLDSNAARTNFYVDLRIGVAIVDTAYGPFYARNATGHDDTGGYTNFQFQLLGPTVGLNFATRREAGAGDVNLDGGWIILKRFEQKTVVTSVTIS